MPKPTKGARLGGSASHQKHILANLAGSLFEHGKITTTEAKAKKLRPYAEKLITHAKNGSLAARREVLKDITNKDIVHTLFSDVAPSFSDRNGGYTRIIKVENRKGDNAPMAIIELVKGELVTTEASRAARVAASRSSKTSDKADDHSAHADSDAEAPTSSDADTHSENTEDATKDSTDSGTDEDQAKDVSADS